MSLLSSNFSGNENQGQQIGINIGPAYFSGLQMAPPSPNYELGLSLGRAPQIDDDIFAGRKTELAQLEEFLEPATTKQNIVALWGLGGIGKTQLSIHFARLYQHKYSSIIWLNAKDENTLKAELVDLSSRILSETECKVVVDQKHENQAVQYIRKWLSEPENQKWLVIFDNYDDPQLPGIQSSTGYDIRQFFPHRAQGSILITTRSAWIRFGKQVRLQRLEDLQQSLAILENVSGRETKEDMNAKKLAKRLDGLPLALTTAGTYIRHSTESFGDYLQLYEESWGILARHSDELSEYANRTLYSTWNLSLKQVEAQDPEAVHLLRMMAYLGNQDLWYELFQNGAKDKDEPEWLSSVTKSKPRFNKAMRKLQEYSLVEAETSVKVQPRGYSLHTCVHDWTLEYLNHETNSGYYCLAFCSVAKSMKYEDEAEFWMMNRRLLQHVNRLENERIKRLLDWNFIETDDMHKIAYLNDTLGRTEEAEAMYRRALIGYEKAWGTEHVSTLNTVNNLGSLYSRQGRMVEAEAMYQRALIGFEKAWGTEHTSTLNTVHNLGNLYSDQGRMVEAEAMYQRALVGYEKVWGTEHMSTLNTVNNLGSLYIKQGKLTEAEAMLQRALIGFEKVWNPEHPSTFNTIFNLGILYIEQGKFTDAEAMLKRALIGFEKVWNPEHPSTLNTILNLGVPTKNRGSILMRKQC